MINHVVFDFDGVIIDSHSVQIKALNESYKSIVGEGTPPIKEFFFHSGNSLENIFPKLGLPLEMIPIYRHISQENIDSIKLHNGAYALLSELNRKKITCSLCTGKERKRTMSILRKLDLEKYFSIIVCSDDVDDPKPNPQSLIQIRRLLQCSKQDMIMVGDGINDILVARNFGIEVIAVSWGDLSRDELGEYNPDYIVETMDELKEIILLS